VGVLCWAAGDVVTGAKSDAAGIRDTRQLLAALVGRIDKRVTQKVAESLPPPLQSDLDALATGLGHVLEKASPSRLGDDEQDVVFQIGAEEGEAPGQRIPERQFPPQAELVSTPEDGLGPGIRHE